MDYLNTIEIGAGSAAVLLTTTSLVALRRVVPTNEVHIVQRSKSTTSYGTGKTAVGVDGKPNGNVYYEIPSWMPVFGVSKVVLPTSVFKLELDKYVAYDKGRLEFEIDVVAFFRIEDSNVAAQRVSSIEELEEQLEFILKGAARTILASYDINEIMVERSKFGEHFTKEVDGQLANWGVITVKSIELLDVRDAAGSSSIKNIMAKQKSFIDMESRKEVAKNQQEAQMAEVAALQEVEIRKQESLQVVGLREAEVTKTTGIANEQALQAVREQARITKEKDMAVLQVATVQEAEIKKLAGVVQAEQVRDVATLQKEANITVAEQQKAVRILEADAAKQTAVLTAEGQLVAATNTAKGIELQGIAKATAEQALLLAPVNAQIALAEKIGSDAGYQNYLLGVETIKANQAVGIAAAENIGKSDIKMNINASGVNDGLSKVTDILTPKGGFAIGQAIEAFANTDAGKSVAKKFGISMGDAPTPDAKPKKGA